MDSHWFNQTTKMMNGYDNNAGNKIDLTLKLGLPNCGENYQQPHHIGQYLHFDQITPHHAHLEGINHSKMVMNEGMNMSNIGESFNANEISWSPSKFGNQFIPSQYGFSPFSSSSNNTYHYPHYNNFNINPNNINLLGGAPALNDYTVLDVPWRRVDRNLGIGNLAHWNTGMRRQCGGRFFDPFKRCTNYSCNTNDTPLWRRGPLGPKTLCNACGIKYRKEEEKRKAKQAGRSNSQDSNAPNSLSIG